ncbi:MULTISPECIES: GNAT family N-acetyltransferase [Pseudomonas syringae group]|uniref:GNAT family N-acetyltransferase n=2 Tax=Pseudomonas syringae group TaxID=136849 RepID=A0ABX6HJN7_9PSED|nr:GNAT family N-acetyltransferase [Pseudomonas asturiensis]QHF05847.1 GNAT family N-acetyltransferase [Pseudomonas asturiensis]
MYRTTARLMLRKPTANDLDSLFAIYGDPATQQFNPSGPLRDIGQAKALLDAWLNHWEEKGYGQWAISTREAPQKLIGFGGLDARMYLEIERLNLGYRFATTAWGKGYATELSEAALVFGFEELGLQEVFAVVRPNHSASIRVLEKTGMQRVDLLNDVPGQPPSLVFRAHRSLPAKDK